MSNKLINFYTLDRIQKKLPKYKDGQYEHTKIKIDTRFLIVGASGAGKTNALMNYIYLTTLGKGTFDHIFLCYKTEEILYDDLIEQLGENISVYKTLDAFPDCQQFPDMVKAKKITKYLCIFDDCVNDKDAKSVKKINEYFAFSRKKGITCCFISQSYFDCNTFIRKNMNYLLMLSISGIRDLTAIMKEFNIANVDKETLLQIYKNAVKKESKDDMAFLKINTGMCPDNEKFSRNFDGFIDF